MIRFKSLNTGVKKGILGLFVVACVFLLTITPSLAQTVENEQSAEAEYNHSGVKIKAKLSAGILNGESREIVYNPDNNWKTSELIWELDTVYMLGGSFSIRPLQWFGFNLEGWAKISDGKGSMDDYDWLVYGMTDWTHWSHHDKTDVTKGTMFDLNAEFFVLNKKKFSLSLLAGYKRNNWQWKAYGGDYVYSVNGFRDETGTWPDDELGITYEQWFDVPYFGIGFCSELGPVQLSGRLIGSTLVDAEDEDHHHMRNLVFNEDFKDGDFIGFQLGATYKITRNIGVGLGLDYQKFDEIKGSTTIEDATTGVVQHIDGDSAGIDNDILLLSLSVVFEF